jgi:hypothetical protein
VLASIPFVIVPAPFLEIDPGSREIVVYRRSPRRQPQDHLPLEEIRLFVAYRCRWTGGDDDSSCYAVTESGVTYPLIAQLGSLSAVPSAKALGYLCQKLSVEVTEEEPFLGPLSWHGPIYKAKWGRPVDVANLLSVATVLYDPSSTKCPYQG